MKWIDMPPLWTALFAMLAWAQARWYPVGGFGAVGDFLAGLLVGGGVLLMALAVYEMRRHRTTVIPHRVAERLVTSGVFKRSRNPIYLGDTLLLSGLILYWDAALALPLIPVFVWVIERRFIEPEESRMRRKFRAEFARYERDVGRWL